MNPDNHDENVNAQIEALWRTHRDRVAHQLARRVGRPKDDCDVQDAVAATFERATKYLGRGRTIDASPLGWLLTVAWHEYLRQHERLTRYDRLNADQEAELAGDGSAVDEEVAERERRGHLDRALERALARLKPRERTVLLEVDAGYTYREIQARHGLSNTAVNKALQSARAKLRNDGAFRKAFKSWAD